MTSRPLWLLLILLAALAACSEDDEGPVEIGLIWSDEFEGPAGELPDATFWTFDLGTGWGNAQLEYTTNRAENASLDGDGNLAITAREESYLGRDYTSARIKTEGKFDVAYGRIEARIKLPVGQGLWPAFWMLGSDFGQVGWPDCGEIDIMEYRGQNPRELIGTAHGPGYSGGASIGATHTLGQGGFHLSFHTFAIEWSENQIRWIVDGFEYHHITPQDLPPGTQWVFDHPFFILLNVAVGGRFVGSPDETTEFPQTMLVDWVRVYGPVN
jgi:beta-glucanase (GH16 family)